MDLKIAGYCRLSRDDASEGESSSIVSQKLIIKNYCDKNGWQVNDFYVDDGVSGTTFNRPQFIKLIEDVEKGNINCIITKDLSRLGRDYIMTGYYTEVFFPEKKIRYIAINDNVDSKNNSNSNDFAPIKNIFNDMYARDISRKVRASMYVKAINGEHFTAYAAMGYKKSKIEKNKLEIDEEIAPVIRAIFYMYMKGSGCQEIRNYLHNNKVRNPSAWAHFKGYTDNSRYGYDEDESKQYKWSNEMVTRILKNETYIGSTVHYRQRKANHKSRSRKRSKEEQLIIKNTHEPIIDLEVFERVQNKLKLHCKPKNLRENIFIGITKCSDCGGSMKLGQSTRIRKRDNVEVTRKHLSCSNNNKYGRSVCTCHYTDYFELIDLTIHIINVAIKKVKTNEGELMKNIEKLLSEESLNENKSLKTKLNKLHRREKDIENIFIKLYEDKALGTITEANFKLLSNKYENEKIELKEEMETIEATLKEIDHKKQNAKDFIDIVKDLQEIKELDRDIISTLIDKIVIFNGEGRGKNKKQRIDIYFKFIGNIDIESSD